jgi:hypothetical protein
VERRQRLRALQVTGCHSDNCPVQRGSTVQRRGIGLSNLGVFAVISALVLGALVGLDVVAPQAASASPAARTHPYDGGGVLTFGDAQNYGSPTTMLSTEITGMGSTPDGQGYWLVGADGGVFAYGDAQFFGSTGAMPLAGPVVAIAPTPDGKGYWLAALDGGVFAFGDAGFYGSMGASRLAQPIVDIAATPDGKGYWLVAGDGGVFSFGDATFHGSTGAMHLAAGVTGMAVTPDGGGYWLVAGDGGVFAFGDASFLGSLAGKPIPAGIVGIAVTPDGAGYWMAGNDGTVYTFGDAPNRGSSSSTDPLSPVSAIAATPDGKGYWLLEPDDWSYSFADPPPYTISVSGSVTAVATSQVGPDPNNSQGAWCNPYGPCEPWCSLFVTWVWQQVGIAVPSYPFTGSLFSWGAGHGRLLPANAVPAPGDALLFGTGPQSVATSVHTGIVAETWPDGAVITVEGDAGPAPDGKLNVVVNGPFLLSDSANYNGFPVYSVVQPVR